MHLLKRVGKGHRLGRQPVEIGGFELELKEAIYFTRFGSGFMYIDKFFRHTRAVIFCVSAKPRDNADLSKAQGSLRPLLNEYFLHQAPVLILYQYQGRDDQLPPEELERKLSISDIGTDNPYRSYSTIQTRADPFFRC
jgi:hypothetical protein